MDDSRAQEQPPKPIVVAPYLVVLLVAALAGVWLMHAAADTWHAAREAGAFPADVRRRLAFAVLFNAGMAGAIALAAAGELVATAVRLLRKAPVVRTALRLGFALLLMVVFVAGHHLLNPWVGDVVRAVRAMRG